MAPGGGIVTNRLVNVFIACVALPHVTERQTRSTIYYTPMTFIMQVGNNMPDMGGIMTLDGDITVTLSPIY
jgi:hypothetical protein